MKISKEGVIVQFDKKERRGDRLFIPKNVVGVDENRFFSRFSLLDMKNVIEVEDGNSAYFVKNGCLIERAAKKIVLAERGATVPGGGDVEVIGEGAFCQHDELCGTLVIPDGVKTIERAAFSACTGITKVRIPASVTHIERGAFSGCNGLVGFDVCAGNEKYYAQGNCLFKRAESAPEQA